MTTKISSHRALSFLLAIVLFLAGAFARPTLSHLKTGAVNLAEKMFHVQQHSPVCSPYDQLYYEFKSSQYASLGKARNIVFLGDSRVDVAEWSELFGREDISNRGISGDTTTGVVQRLRTSIPNHIQLCVIQLGVNDLSKGCSVEFVVAQYSDILSDLTTRVQASVIITSIIFCGQGHAELNPTIMECNRKLAELATSRGALFVDINRPLCPDGTLSASYSNDGVHLNGVGYKQVCRILTPYLNRYAPNTALEPTRTAP